MSDRGDTPAAEEAAATPATTTITTTTTSATTATVPETESKAPVTRYTYQVLMSLRDSPLVAKPPDMPPLSTWFGDDPEAPLSKSILNGAITSRALANSLDRNVLLAPNKSIFSAQNYGKRTMADDDSNTSTSTRTTQSHTSSRYRHNNDELRPYNSNSYNNNNSNNDRDLRSSRNQNYSTEWGLSNNNNNNNNRYNNRRVNNKNQHRSISPLQNTKRQQQQQHQHHHQDRNHLNESPRNRRENARDKTSTNKFLNGDATQQQQQRSSDKLPEWMDYNPSAERKPVRQLDAIPPAPPPGFSNDLEAWKSDMKLRDQSMEANESSQPSLQEKNGQPKKEASDLDLLLGGMSSVDLHKPQQQQQQSAGMDFLSSSMLDSPSLPGRRERGSRFAKFFAKREEEAVSPVVEQLPPQQQPPSSIPAQGKSISVNDLFGGNLSQTPPPQQQQEQHGSGEVKMSYSQGPASAPRMLSEEEVLQSLGAKRSPQQHKEKPAAEDAMGFDKVLQILSQPKPTSPYDVKKDDLVEQQESSEPVMVAAVASETPKQQYQEQHIEDTVPASSPKPPFEPPQQQHASPVSAATPTATHEETTVAEASPVRVPAEKHHMRTDSTDSAQAQRPKLVGKAFAGNLPTSVLRQMSARTSEGRSPSIASSKSANRSFAAGSSSAGGSPALSNHSPSTIKSGIPMVSHQQHPQQQAHSPVQQLPYTSNAYQQPQRMPATSPGYPLPGHSPVVDPIAAAGAPASLGRQPRNLEQLLQYGVAAAAAAGGAGGSAGGAGDGLSPPVMPRSGMNGNGPMMGPHHPHHQHHHQPPPHHHPQPHHPFQGQGGMEQFIPPHLMQPMPPHMGPVGPGPMLQPHHLPPQLQGQVPHQFPPMQREMMTPPTSDHPAYMGNVPPPHMMGNGLPPHLFAKSQGWDRH